MKLKSNVAKFAVVCLLCIGGVTLLVLLIEAVT